MKKYIFLILSVLIMSTSAYASEPTESGIVYETNVIYIAGKAENVDVVTILLKNGEKLAYISEIPVNNGEYECKFRVRDTGTSEDYTLFVRSDDGTVYTPDIAVKTVFDNVFDIEINQANGTYSYGLNDTVKLVANIKNKYGIKQDVMLIVASYDKNDRLLGISADNDTIDFNINQVIDTVSDLKLPVGTARVKGYIWEDETLKPLTDAYDRKMELSFAPYSNEETVVAFYGDSLIHIGGFVSNVEKIYNLRYPKNDILFLNKGIGGDTIIGLNDRFEWDILNDTTPIPDYLVISVGYNDLNWVTEDQMWVYDRYYNNYQSLIDKCKEKGITPIIMGFSNYDTYGDGNEVKPLLKKMIPTVNEKLKSIAAENEIEFIDTYSVMEKYINKVYTEKPELNGPIFNTMPDRIHQTEEGKLLKAVVFLAEQKAGSTVAGVEIDGTDVKTINCDVVNLTNDGSTISYEYSPKALPVAYSDTYKKIENIFGVSVTDIINKEIIKVAGLVPSQSYSVEFDDDVVGEFTGAQLEAGVNIANLADNPGQVIAKEVSAMTASENGLRNIASSSQLLAHLEVDVTDQNAVENYINSLNQDWSYLYNTYTYTKDDLVQYLENLNKKQDMYKKLIDQKTALKNAAVLKTYQVRIY